MIIVYEENTLPKIPISLTCMNYIWDELYNRNITNQNKNIELYLLKNDSKVLYGNKFSQHKKSELQNTITFFHFKKFLQLWIEHFNERRNKFSHRSEMCMSTVSSIGYKTYEF